MKEHKVLNPSTGEPIGTWRDATPEELEAALAGARTGAATLADMSRWDRCDLLVETGRQLAMRREEAVADLMREHGKIQQEAEAELDTAIHSFEMAAEYARRLDGHIPEVSDSRKRVLVRRIPLGVVGVVTPWNFPINIPVEYLAPALAMGNSVVWKGAESTPLSTANLMNSIRAAGWPTEAVAVLQGGPRTGAALVRRPELSVLGFTGSSEVGREIAAVGGMRKLLLELGGNGPTVVFNDADLERAAISVVAAATLCSGQSCSATERVIVQEGAYKEFQAAVVDVAEEAKVGAPGDYASSFGPLHLAQTAATMRMHVDEAVAGGARILAGGKADSSRPTDHFWPLTVLADVRHDASVFTQETFGPIVPIKSFSNEADLAQHMTRGGYGLSGAVFTRDIERAFRVAEEIPCGTVVVNDRSDTWETHIPFGGFPGQSSGIGRVGGPHPMLEMSTVKTMVLDVS